MGSSTAETVKEIEETRARLDSEVKELERRLPAAPAIRRMAAIAAGSGVGGTVFWTVLRRVRKHRKAKRHAEVAPVAAVPVAVPSIVGQFLQDEELKGWLIIAGGVWLLLRLIEIRSIRRTVR
jgi:hypothetical protein